jgi:uncharacterized protein (DUF2147 family)
MRSLIVLASAALAASTPPPAPALIGNWRNPHGTVELRIARCSHCLCGTVVRASSTAISDAREAGYPALVGMELMKSYCPAGPLRWEGTIFVPDLGRSFSSHVQLLDRDRARVAGCLVGQYVCRSQIWYRS